jgi:transposase
MEDPRTVPECPKCADWIQHAERLERKISRQAGEIAELIKQVKALQQKLAETKKDSTNSSKPPSSDITKPRKKLAAGQRRRGGQLGHGPQQRPPFELREIDDIQLHTHESCPQCGGSVEQVSSTRVVQQVELVARPTLVTEHHSGTCHCHACGASFTKPVPPETVGAGLFGPRLPAWIAYLKGDCHTSFSTIRKLLQDTFGLRVTNAMLAKLCQKVSRSLQAPYEELQRAIPQQERLNADETSHRENGKWQWTWVFRARHFTFFYIDPTRSGSVLELILGSDFTGTVGSDYYSVYRSYLDSHPLAKAQFCLAHLVRDVKALQLLPDEREHQYAAELLVELAELFRLWHARVDVTDEATWRALLIAQGEQLDRVATERVPE